MIQGMRRKQVWEGGFKVDAELGITFESYDF